MQGYSGKHIMIRNIGALHSRLLPSDATLTQGDDGSWVESQQYGRERVDGRSARALIERLIVKLNGISSSGAVYTLDRTRDL